MNLQMLVKLNPEGLEESESSREKVQPNSQIDGLEDVVKSVPSEIVSEAPIQDYDNQCSTSPLEDAPKSSKSVTISPTSFNSASKETSNFRSLTIT